MGRVGPDANELLRVLRMPHAEGERMGWEARGSKMVGEGLGV